MTLRQIIAAFCRGFADALDPPTPARPVAFLPEQLAAPPPVSPGERALTKAEFEHALCDVYLRRALHRFSPEETFEA